MSAHWFDQFEQDVLEAKASSVFVSPDFYLMLKRRFPDPGPEITGVPVCRLIVDYDLSGLTWVLPTA